MMEAILEHLWVLFIGIGTWMANRLTGKIDELEKNKSTNISIDRVDTHIRDIDKRVDEVAHTMLPRSEFKSDIAALHNRLNEMERNKADKIKNIRTHPVKGSSAGNDQ